ncbi:MAG: tRNA (guanosine(37)-N1)-methyltransferase TrmD [Armatimonadetes bacterium]|nr:tRNA (guanosine(37)-N1)-methyltransferase TrmD [Armatimonadota bacterium]
MVLFPGGYRQIRARDQLRRSSREEAGNSGGLHHICGRDGEEADRFVEGKRCTGGVTGCLKIDILTIFPEMVQTYLRTSILGRAVDRSLLQAQAVDLRKYSTDRHGKVDDYPYGGGHGMVMCPGPIFDAVTELRKDSEATVILMSPGGKTFDQAAARELSGLPHLVLICGHYEGVDERVREHLVDREVSLGDFILTGGELAALAVTDAVARLLPGVLAEDSAREESFEEFLLEYPQYTRPQEYMGWRVPEVLLSGHHAEIRRWRRREAIRRTLNLRPDLIGRAGFSEEDAQILAEVRKIANAS